MKKIIEQINKAKLKDSPGLKENTVNALNIALSKIKYQYRKNELSYDEAKIKVLNVGSGKGLENLWILENSNVELSALDAHEPYLLELESIIKKNGFSKRLKTYLDDVSSMPFKKNSFDIIWCEGSIYNLGFERGIKEFKKYLKPKGVIVVADYILKEDGKAKKIPLELKRYFEGFHPSIESHENNIIAAENAGYKLSATFNVSEEAWWKNYLSIIREECKNIEFNNQTNIEIKKDLKEIMIDLDMHEKYKDYYDYAFYILQKTK